MSSVGSMCLAYQRKSITHIFVLIRTPDSHKRRCYTFLSAHGSYYKPRRSKKCIRGLEHLFRRLAYYNVYSKSPFSQRRVFNKCADPRPQASPFRRLLSSESIVKFAWSVYNVFFQPIASRKGYSPYKLRKTYGSKWMNIDNKIWGLYVYGLLCRVYPENPHCQSEKGKIKQAFVTIGSTKSTKDGHESKAKEQSKALWFLVLYQH